MSIGSSPVSLSPLLEGSEVSSAARAVGTDAWKREQRAVIRSAAPGARLDLTLRFATY